MPKDSYLDLVLAITDWATSEYDDIANKKQRKLRQKEKDKKMKVLGVNIDWSDVHFDDKTIKFPLVDGKKGKSKTKDSNDNADKVGAATAVTSGLPTAAKPTTSVLFQTTFKNKTNRVQEYTMRTEKTTRSCFSVETESGYTKGFDMSVSLKTPCEVLEVNAGYHREYSLTNISGESFEEELNWGVDSVIKVNKHHEAEAKLVVFEEKKSGIFEIKTEIRGRVFVNFTNIRDNNSLVMSVSEDISAIIDDFVKIERRKGKQMDYVTVDTAAGTVAVTTTGKCGFEYGVRQEILVDQKPLDGATEADCDGGESE